MPLLVVRKSINQNKLNTMYTSKTITRSDGTKYVQCTRIPTEDQVWSDHQQMVSEWLDRTGCSKD